MSQIETAAAPAITAVSREGAIGAPKLMIAAMDGQPPNFAHARHMLDRFGMAQFARGSVPDMDFGYALDDNARAFLAAMLALHLAPALEDARAVGESGLRFTEMCLRPDGWFHNLMAADGSFTDEIGSEDSFGRTVWALGVAARCAPIADWRRRAFALLEPAVERTCELRSLRARAYSLLGLAAAFAPERAALIPSLEGALPEPFIAKLQQALLFLSRALAHEFEECATPDWEWFEPELTWGNARLPEALLRGGMALNDAAVTAVGLRALAFVASVTHERDVFRPIGNDGWYERGEQRARYDQQPLEACGMVDVWLAAAEVTEKPAYAVKAVEAFGWFLGLNSEGCVMVDTHSGGCRDGLGRTEVNLNMGAESTLSYLHAHCAVASIFHKLSTT